MRALRSLKRSLAVALVILLCVAIPAAIPEPCRYVGSAKSNKYHYPSCQWARRIKPDNLVCFGTAAQAQAKGYIPCKVCSPPVRD